MLLGTTTYVRMCSPHKDVFTLCIFSSVRINSLSGEFDLEFQFAYKIDCQEIHCHINSVPVLYIFAASAGQKARM